MLYQRPIHQQRPLVRILAGILLVAMFVLGILGAPPESKSQTVEWRDPVGLPALNGNDGSGRSAPAPLQVDLDGSFPVSVSIAPTLVWRKVPGAVGQVRFAITTLAEKNPRVLWDRKVAVGADGTARVQVPVGTLQQGQTYLWFAESTTTTGVRSGPHALTVDVQRAGTQPVWTYRDLAVAEGTGELVYTHRGATLDTVGGPVGWTLIHRPTNTPERGLPRGWRFVVTGTTGWDALRLNADGSVTLTTDTGVSVTYIRRGADQWQPQVGRYNSAGETTLLAQAADGSFSATDGNRVVTVFSKPTANQPGKPVRVWAMDTPTLQQSWEDGRLRTLTDPVTGNTTGVLYGGDPGCGTQTDPGFIPVPAGLLCGVVDWGGNVTMAQYVQTATGPQIGRIVTGVGLGPNAQVADIGWDDAGRIAETREPFATTAVASGVVDGLGVQDPRVLTEVAYDDHGRVARLTAPAGLIAGDDQPSARERRASTTFSYAPFSAAIAGDAVRVAPQHWLDPLTLQIVRERDASGNIIVRTYDEGGRPTRVEDVSSGTVTVTRYNRYGKPVEQLGPTKGLLSSPTTPRTTTAYDQDERGRDWTGLAALYWANAGFAGAPTGGSTGPVVGGAKVAGLQFNWPSSPAGGTGPWSARLTGVYEAPRDGAYAFENSTSASLWVNGRLCAATCTVRLAAGDAARLQVDVSSPTGGAAGIAVKVTEPGAQGPAPVSTAQLRPSYGLTTSTTVRENGGSGVEELTTRMVYDEQTGQLLQTISPSGSTQTRTYEPYDPARGQWGRSTSVTDASGKVTRSSFYGADEVATDCTGAQIDQDAGLAATVLPGGQVVRHVGLPGGGTATVSDGAAVVCSRTLEASTGTVSTTSGIGPEVVQTQRVFVDGDPMTSSTSTTTAGETSTTIDKTDTNGNVWKSVDQHGTTTITHWNPLTGRADRVTETTRAGQSRSTEYTYSVTGEVATVTVNGNRLIENVYGADGTLLRTELGNGAVQTFQTDQLNNVSRVTTRFPDDTTLTESRVHSPTGRILQRTLSGPSGTATYAYRYNDDGRLVDTRLTGTVPVRETRWKSAFEGAEGRNGNRASETWTRVDGMETTTRFAYGEDNRLLSAEGERFAGPIEYDAAGRATRIGAVQMTYDAAGHLLTAADGNRSYAFSDAGSTTTLTRTVDDVPQTVTATSSGETLVLDAGGRIDAQVVSPADGLQVVLGEGGAPVRWIYDDGLGSATWTSRGDAAPRLTHLYSPDGEAISVARTSAPDSAIDLVLDGMGWMSGTGATTLRLSTPITLIGARAYTSDGGRWLQPDPSVDGSMNAYEYALGDPINQYDPTGHAAWGWIAGAVAATVAGVLIGTLTFGVGAGVVGYGYAALAIQIGSGAVVGAVTGGLAEVVTQLVDRGAVTDWGSVGIAAGIGAGSGALFAGASAIAAKVVAPRSALRSYAALGRQERAYARFVGQDIGAASSVDAVEGYATMRLLSQRMGVKQPGLWRQMFTKGSWKTQMQPVADRFKAHAAFEADLARRGSSRIASASGSAGARSSAGGDAAQRLSVDSYKRQSLLAYDELLAGRSSVVSAVDGQAARGSIGFDQRIAQTQNAEFEAFIQGLLS